MAAKKFNYKQSLKRLEEIVAQIESEEPDVDELSQLVKEATALMKKCKEKLKATEEDIDRTLSDL
ncbi:exodeoxyribonuclease VII small subunit [Fulvivirgaceae bacterium BMA10]|uniref:Exodeoxyribonuclease VII small subunit n=1 Tax=Splendidivirga corallicola TaxID=3051826 RepID=A0ABT8KW29_9BACT|nr:exodeoxyribonuclease VII small subunit [Fulvivirgaceae bacterium BMA10]